MATDHYTYSTNTSQRGLAMVLALASAVVLSPLYVTRRHERRAMEAKWSGSGFVLPMVLAGLIIAIKTTSSNSSSVRRQGRDGGGGDDGGGGGVVGSVVGFEDWEFFVGAGWGFGDVHACAFMAKLCSAFLVEIKDGLEKAQTSPIV